MCIYIIATNASTQVNSEYQNPTLKIAAKYTSPFVVKGQNGMIAGYSVDILDYLLEDYNFTYRFDIYPNNDEIIRSVRESRANIGHTSITRTSIREDEKGVDFSFAFLLTRSSRTDHIAT
jgi:hypothetical protein